MTESPPARLRLGMVGGGRGALIGETHRIAARLDDRYELLAGALSADPQRAIESGRDLRLDPTRCYTDYRDMARAEATRKDGIDVVSVVTPNVLHHAICKSFLEVGIDVICDKPLTTTLADAQDVVATVGSPLNTVVTYFQIIGAEIRVIDCDSDLDLTPVQRVAHMLSKGYLFGSHFLPHDALATQKSGKTFLNELNEVGLRNCKAVPRAHDIWVGINRLRQILPRFSFRIPACERLLEGLSNYHTVRASTTGLAWDEPVHDWASHYADSARGIAEAEAAGMLSSAGSTANVHRRQVTVRTGFRGDARDEQPSILDRFFGPPRRNVRVIR